MRKHIESIKCMSLANNPFYCKLLNGSQYLLWRAKKYMEPTMQIIDVRKKRFFSRSDLASKTEGVVNRCLSNRYIDSPMYDVEVMRKVMKNDL